VSYTNIGEERMGELKIQNYLAKGLPYEPLPALSSGGGMNHLFNAATIGVKIGLPGYGTDIVSASNFASLAKATTSAAFGYRYALVNLRYVVLPMLDYSAHNSNGELDLYDPETDTGTLTEAWIDDRAVMLNWKNQFDMTRKSYGTEWNTFEVQGNWDFIDYRLGTNGQPLKLSVDGIDVTSAVSHQIVFGSNGSDSLVGNLLDDHIYGGTGNDTLSGAGGDDYIEGNANDDELKGGGGNDTLLGGKGSDILEGGQDDDTLLGGAGFDTYIYHTGDGQDTIIDSDGDGLIKIDDEELTGGKALSAGVNTWQSADGTHTYVALGDITQGATLIIDGVLTIQNYTQGQLGLELQEAEGPQEGAIVGDLFKKIVINGRGEQEYVLSATGYAPENDTAPGDNPGAADILLGTSGNDTLRGLAGNDGITGGAGDDLIEGGEGDDLLYGGGGADIIQGGGGDDHIFAGAAGEFDRPSEPGRVWAPHQGATVITRGFSWGIDQFEQENSSFVHPMGGYLVVPNNPGVIVDGGTGEDVIVGGFGRDTLYGGEGEYGDRLYGLNNDDLLLGGAGNDRLWGDGYTVDSDSYVYASAAVHGHDTLYGDAAPRLTWDPAGDLALRLGEEGTEQSPTIRLTYGAQGFTQNGHWYDCSIAPKSTLAALS
jgi:Ca2+-binding RTX toxin-like protein